MACHGGRLQEGRPGDRAGQALSGARGWTTSRRNRELSFRARCMRRCSSRSSSASRTRRNSTTRPRSVPVETITQSQFNEIMKGARDGKVRRSRPSKSRRRSRRSRRARRRRPSRPSRAAAGSQAYRRSRPGRSADPAAQARRRNAAAATPAPRPPRRRRRRPTMRKSIGRSRRVEPKGRSRRPNRRRAQGRRQAAGEAQARHGRQVPGEGQGRGRAEAAARSKAADASVEAPHQPFDPNAIAKLIGQAKTGRARSPSLTPLGSPTQNAPRMSPSLSAALDGWLQEAYLNCWSQPPTMPEGDKYVAQIRVAFNADGSLAARPVLRQSAVRSGLARLCRKRDARGAEMQSVAHAAAICPLFRAMEEPRPCISIRRTPRDERSACHAPASIAAATDVDIAHRTERHPLTRQTSQDTSTDAPLRYACRRRSGARPPRAAARARARRRRHLRSRRATNSSR